MHQYRINTVCLIDIVVGNNYSFQAHLHIFKTVTLKMNTFLKLQISAGLKLHLLIMTNL